jgi:hypothetical protein
MVSDSALKNEVAELKSEIEGLRDDLNAALQAIAGNTGATARQLKRWDDGDALKVTADRRQSAAREPHELGGR